MQSNKICSHCNKKDHNIRLCPETSVNRLRLLPMVWDVIEKGTKRCRKYDVYLDLSLYLIYIDEFGDEFNILDDPSFKLLNTSKPYTELQ
jgi:hypothetical protein